MSDVTGLLSAITRGDPHAAADLLPLVYDELRRLAAQWLAQEAPGQTLQPTALVHEAFVRLTGSSRPESRRGRPRPLFPPPRPGPAPRSRPKPPQDKRAKDRRGQATALPESAAR